MINTRVRRRAATPKVISGRHPIALDLRPPLADAHEDGTVQRMSMCGPHSRLSQRRARAALLGHGVDSSRARVLP
jgi:hypothetical protein